MLTAAPGAPIPAGSASRVSVYHRSPGVGRTAVVRSGGTPSLLGLLERLDELAHDLLGVPVEHPAVLLVEQVVLDPGEPLSLPALDDDDVLGVEDRHSLEGATGAMGRRVDDIIGPDHEDDVGGRELGVDLVAVEQLVV